MIHHVEAETNKVKLQQYYVSENGMSELISIDI